MQEELITKGSKPDTPDWGSDPEYQWGLLHAEKGGKTSREIYPSVKGGFGMFYDNLYQTLVNGAPLQEKGEHGYNTIRMIELALMSSKKKAMIECKGLMNG